MASKKNMSSIDSLFTPEMIDKVDAETNDVEMTYDAFGNPTSGNAQSSDDVIAMDDISLDELFEGASVIAQDDGVMDAEELFASNIGEDSIGAENDTDVMISGIDDDEVTPDAPGRVVDLEAAKRDKRTARSQAHKKKKEAQRKAEQEMQSGLGDPDVMDSGLGDADEISTEVLGSGANVIGASDIGDGDGFSDSGISVVSDITMSDMGQNDGIVVQDDFESAVASASSESKPLITYETEDGSTNSIDEQLGTTETILAGPGAEVVVEDDEEEETVEVDLPDWADSIRRKVNANVAHAFLLHGNVRDYMVRNITIKDGIVAVLDGAYENFDIIAEYDQAHGLSFYGEDIIVDEKTERTLADAYRERFIEEMQLAQRHMSLAVTEDIPNRDAVTLFTILSDIFDRSSVTRQAKILLFIDYSDLLVPDASSAQMKPDERKLAITLADIGRSQAADEAGNVLIFITDDMTQLSTRIRGAESRIEQIKIPIPDRAERSDFIDNVLDAPDNTLSDGTQVFEHEESITKEAFAVNAAGLSRIQIEDIMLRALSEDVPLTIELMKERKQEIIREDYDDVLEIIDPAHGFERVGGMEHMKMFFREEIIEPVHAGEREAVPMGCMLAGPPGTAKSITQNSKIVKKNGFAKAGEVVIGDEIFSSDGMLHKVLGVFPQGKLPVYEVVLKDGRTVECSKDHIWTVRIKTHGKYKLKDMTVEDMLKKGIKEISPSDIRTGRKGHSRFFIPQCQPVNFPAKDFLIDPYVIGAFLGDGCCLTTCADITCSINDIDIVENISDLLHLPFKRTCRGTDLHWTFVVEQADGVNTFKDSRLQTKDLFRECPEMMCRASEKHIPKMYKYGSIEQRYALLQGLMDTDGSINQGTDKNRYNVRFNSVSKQLCEDVIEVANSLGYSCTLTVANSAGKAITGSKERFGKEYYHQNDIYNVAFNIPNEEKHKLFRCKRKHATALEAAKYHKKRHYDVVPIVDIRKLDREDEMVCFMVDSPDHTYLVEDYVVTHNTFLSKAVAKEAGMNFVALNLNRIMEKWVGSTERNLDRALDCALAMAPTIIFIDEIDEALPNRADPNASSVNKRINQRLLTFFSDTSHRGEVIILAATNYPEKIDPAFKRAGRFDVRVPIFAPSEFDRMRIMNVIAKGRGYEFSWFEDPDKVIDNPFKRLAEWIREDNVPDTNVKATFFGNMEMYTYTKKDGLGNDERHDVYLPVRLINVIDKQSITLQQCYEVAQIVFTDMPRREPDAATGLIETDEVYQQQILDYLMTRVDVLGPDQKNIKKLHKRLWRWEMIYSTFVDQTFRMTGAEMDVIMNKAINLFKKWKRQVGPEKVQQCIDAGIIKHDRDIPWQPFLYDACKKTVNAVAGIKEMEDQALINTSDVDFIPDALYIQTDDGRMISYLERHEELSAKQTKSTI